MESLKGQFLVAMPGMGDERFHEAVIYIVGHGEEGAMGLMVNQPLDDLRFADILDDAPLSLDGQRLINLRVTEIATARDEATQRLRATLRLRAGLTGSREFQAAELDVVWGGASGRSAAAIKSAICSRSSTSTPART